MTKGISSGAVIAGFMILIFSGLQGKAQLIAPDAAPAALIGPKENAADSTVEYIAKVSSDSATAEAFDPPNAVATTETNDQPICGISHLGRCIRDLGEDEKGVLTSPFRVQTTDVFRLAPLGAATGLAFAYDDRADTVGTHPSRTNTANTIAAFGSFLATGGESAGIYFAGLAANNPKLAETGRLSAEAVIVSGSVTLAVKLAANRQSPRQGDGQGDFWPYGFSHWEWDSSFPSDHATASMAMASVISGEYPYWYVKAPAYGFAEAVGISKIVAKKHFSSDVIVGQAIGFLTGNYVLSHRAIYRSGKRAYVTRVMKSVMPDADVGSGKWGASIDIPLGR